MTWIKKELEIEENVFLNDEVQDTEVIRSFNGRYEVKKVDKNIVKPTVTTT
ncbi:MAG: hypothetical protein R3B65_02005 [Candidatus Paceibacterota bacterium]